MNKFFTVLLLVAQSGMVLADGAAKPGNPFGSSGLVFVLIIGMMYFLMIRPQNKKAKEHKSLLSKLAEGDEVITSGGIVGQVESVSDNFLVLNVFEGKLTVQRQSVAQALPKGTLKSIQAS